MKAKNTQKARQGRKLAKAFRAAMPLVLDRFKRAEDHPGSSPFVCDCLWYLQIWRNWQDNTYPRKLFQDIFCVGGSWRNLSFSGKHLEMSDADVVLAYGARIIALELAALLAEEGYTEEDFQ